jgi:hypothetical protein
MNKLPFLLLSAALLAACGTAASSSGSAGLRETTNVGTVRLSQGANADTESDVNRVNPTITKGTRPHPVSPAQPQTPVPNSTQSQTPVDRCNGGIGAGQGAGNQSSTATGKHLPLPACMPQ